MAREHAAIRLDMWSDDDWRALSVPAQYLYMHLLSAPNLSYAGVADWRPARIAGHSAGTTVADVVKAADELAGALFVIRDEETEEILVRSFLKHDGLLQKPNVAKAMVSAFAKTVSPVLRGVIVHELVKLYASHPEWKAFDVDSVQALLTRTAIDPVGLTYPSSTAKGSGKGSAKGSVKGSEVDASLLTPNSLLLTPDSTHLSTSSNDVRDDVQYLCDLLVDLIVGNGSKRPMITEGWKTSARLMLVNDGRELGAAEYIMRWCQEDDFWLKNILSMPTFRKRYDQLRLAADVPTDYDGNFQPQESVPAQLSLAAEPIATWDPIYYDEDDDNVPF
ncbi:hypothetical protein E3O45_05970 [Cryobacterium sp. TMS1-20-1]|uniref:hypothetical protein n=1 Tax=Cryobacterium sp. TMS1-20-1 TaxID=1259223 RepID=UPI00106AF3E9|nr:hypothetical protein [Cryobacterium sp. TMS1-20-1]TFC78159.1 hypothetical protein E3O45_05970 [Cryobacterium sp. TMS1-20-1]